MRVFLSEPGFLGFWGLTGLGAFLRACIYDRRGWADLKGACVSGVDSWPPWIPAFAGMTKEGAWE